MKKIQHYMAFLGLIKSNREKLEEIYKSKFNLFLDTFLLNNCIFTYDSSYFYNKYQEYFNLNLKSEEFERSANQMILINNSIYSLAKKIEEFKSNLTNSDDIAFVDVSMNSFSDMNYLSNNIEQILASFKQTILQKYTLQKHCFEINAEIDRFNLFHQNGKLITTKHDGNKFSHANKSNWRFYNNKIELTEKYMNVVWF